MARRAALLAIAALLVVPSGQSAAGAFGPLEGPQLPALEESEIECTWAGIQDRLRGEIAVVRTAEGYAAELRAPQTVFELHCARDDQQYLFRKQLEEQTEIVPLDEVEQTPTGFVLSAVRRFQLPADHNGPPNGIDLVYDALFCADCIPGGGGKPSIPNLEYAYKIACSFDLNIVNAGTGSEWEEGLLQEFEGVGGGPIVPLGCAVAAAGAAIICVNLSQIVPGHTCAWAAGAIGGGVGLLLPGVADGALFAGRDNDNDVGGEVCTYESYGACSAGSAFETDVGGYPQPTTCVTGEATVTATPLVPLPATAHLTVPACDGTANNQQ